MSRRSRSQARPRASRRLVQGQNNRSRLMANLLSPKRRLTVESLEQRMLLFGNPVINEVSPLPADGQNVFAAIDQLTVSVSEDIQETSANNINHWSLVGAGPDGTLGTGDDVNHALSLPNAYVSGTTIILDIDSRVQPLQLGQYRFTATAGLVDLDAQPLDGNGDSIGGDDFVTTFTVTTGGGQSIESPSNNSLELADSLDLVESPVGSGYTRGIGLGAIQAAGDIDYWTFDAFAGDRIAISVNTPDSNMNPYLELRNSADGVLASDDNSGPDNDAFISYYTVTSSGSFNARITSQSNTTGHYELRVDVARGIDLESDGQYANDSISGADSLNLSLGAPGQVLGVVNGTIMATEGSNPDEDYFSLGRLDPGNTIALTTTLPSLSTLDANVRVVDSGGTDLADTDGSESGFSGAVVGSDDYYVLVTANLGGGPRGQYLLNVDIGDNVSPTVFNVSGLPEQDATSSEVISSLSLTFSERMDPATVLAADAFQLQEAGADGLLNTPDDIPITVTVGSAFNQFSRSVSLQLQQGPLDSGLYQFSVANSVRDRAGNQMDGDGDGNGGDPFLRTFTLDLPASFVLEGPDNDSLSGATPIPLTENPVGDHLFLGFGLGSIDPTTDYDWWSFEAQAGDRVAIAADTASSLRVGPRLYNSGGGEVTNGFGGGPDDDGYLSHYLVPATGTYYVRLERYYGDSIGSYELRVELARGIDLESDQDYNNDSFGGADAVTLTQTGNQRSGTIAGTIMDRQGGNLDEDRFQLGLLNAGNQIDLSLSLPSSSTLVPNLQVFDGNGVELLDEDGDPSNGFLATVLADGDYYAQVSNDYWVHDGRAYALLGSQSWANAQTAAVALGGNLVTIDDAAEQTYLRNTFSSWDPWIGIHDADGNNTFVWVDGTPVSYTNWYPGEPNTASYDGAYLENSDGLWRDYPKGNSLTGIAEWADPLGRTSAGPGPLAQYVLDITVSDPIPPQVTNVSRLPDGGTTSQLISTFNVTVSEDLKASTVNTPLYTYAFNPATGNTYLLAGSAQTWNQAEAQAQSLGGHLVTIDDQAEQDWLLSNFGGSSYFWIGLSDQDANGDWSTWADGTPVGYQNWGSNYPIPNAGYDFAYMQSSNGVWYTYPNTASTSWRGLIEIPGGNVDSDNDGTPDPVDSHPTDPLNGWDLREAGADGIFDSLSTPSSDDVIYDLRLASNYSTGTDISLRIYDGPLHDGNYQLTIRSSLSDVVGNPLDGNDDFVGGDDYVRTFSVDLPDGFVYEGQSNDTLATATPLALSEDPTDSGLFLTAMFGLGSIDPTTDYDWWSFEAQAGDRVAIAADTASSLRVGPRLYNSGGGEVTNGFGGGPDDDGYLSHYLVPATGTYYVRLERYYGDSIGSYELRVELARGIDLESDQDYNNDSFGGADAVTLTQTGNQRSGTIAGTIMDRQGGNLDEDRFQLGLLNAGNQIDLSLSLPSSSTLVPNLQVFDGNGVELLDEDGDPSNGFLATVLADGDYYAQVSNDYWVHDGRAYALLGSQSWANAQTAAVALGGNLVTIDDAAEQTYLRNTFSSWDPWIGIHDADGNNTFVWVDGTPVSYTNWYPGEPNTASYDGAYLENSDGLWRDYPKGNSLTGIAEWADPLGRTSAGPGPLAQYVLDITVSDPIPPQVTNVSRLPDGGATSQLISTFNVTVSEDLKASTVNTPLYTYAFNPATGNTYLLAGSAQTWNQAEAQAQSLGGHLVTIDDQAEQDWLLSNFGGSSYFWIGLSDQDANGDWSTWADGTPVGYQNWGSNYPIPNAGYDFAYMQSSNGIWYTYPNTTSTSWRGLIEIPGGNVDSDNDGTPDPVDSHPTDPLNGWDLREAGADGIFDSLSTPSSDDVIYDLRLASNYSTGTDISLRIYDGPLPEGKYQLSVTASATDLVDNPLDGDGDGVGGDNYVRTFFVDFDETRTFEGGSNESLASATSLSLSEDPNGSGLFLGRGLGSIDPSNDLDWWSFAAEAGDRVAIAADTAGGLRIGPRLYNSGGGEVTNGFGGGPDDDGYLSHYLVPATGTYYVRLERYYGDSIGSYDLRVELARGIDLESDQDYNNDTTSGADPLTYSVSGNQRNATIAGTIMRGQSGNVDEDYFALGSVAAGETVFSRVTLPSTSTLSPVIEIRDASNAVVSINPNPTDASIARYDIQTTGLYYVVILGQKGQGPDGQYLLDTTIGPTSELQFADLSVSDITLPSPAAADSGDTISIGWTVGNFGTAATDVNTWFDRVVLSADQTYGNGDDRHVGSILHTGSLDVGQSYTASANVTIPLDASGPYYFFVETDEQSDVFEFTLTDNNVTQSETLDVTLSPLPDLKVQNLTVTGPDPTGLFTFNWNTANTGSGAATGGFDERLRVINTVTGASLSDVSLNVAADIAAGDSLPGTSTLSLSVPGPYQITITTDRNDTLYEHNAGGHLAAEQNNTTSTTFSATVDVTIENLSIFPPNPEPGDTLSISWDNVNHGNLAAASTFYDRVQVTRLASATLLLGQVNIADLNVPQNTILGPGESKSASVQVTLPQGINGVGEVQVLLTTDRYNAVGEFNAAGTAETNNQTSKVVTSNIDFADLLPVLQVSPSQGDIGQSVDVAWTVSNNAANATGSTPVSSWYDAIVLSRDAVFGNGDDVLLAEIRHNSALVLGASYTDAATVTLPNDFFGDGFLFVKADNRNEVYEFSYEDNNFTAASPIEILAPDLIATAQLSTFTGVFGDTIPIDYTVSNAGNGSAFGNVRDRVWLSSDQVLGTGDRLLATVDAAQIPLAAGASYTQNDLLVNLPLDVSLAVGDYFLIVETDALDNQPESDENNNQAATIATISLAFPPLPDLQVENPGLVESSPTSGDTVTLAWQTVNEGTVPVTNSFTERIVIVNSDTGQTLLSTNVPLIVSVDDPIDSGEVINRTLSFDLPDGIPGAGSITATITTDFQNDVVESFTGNIPETNNTSSTTFISALPPYPDLIVENPIATPASLLTGEEITLSWTIDNNGTAPAAADFQQRIRIDNTTTGKQLFETIVQYDVASDGAIPDGTTKNQSRTIKIPDGSGSVGDLQITIIVDSSNTLFELNPTDTAESNNSAVTSVTTSLAPYPDLLVSNVVAPTETIADPANVTVSWQVDNIGTLTASSGNWFDAVIASTDEIIGDSDDRLVALFQRTTDLAPGDSYLRTETFQLPPAFTGRYFLYVQSDHSKSIFEDGRLDNNQDRSPDVFDVMPIPYADVVVTSVSPEATGFSGQPLEVSWRVENQGIGLTNRANWTDYVYLATDPAGTHRIATLGSFPHLGQLAVNDGYDRTVSVTLPQGISGTHYLVVHSGGSGLFEFIHTDNNETVSGGFEVELSTPPDLIVSDIQAPTLAVLEGTLIDISWTVKNDGIGDAEGFWEDTVYLRKVGDPSAPTISLGAYRYDGPLAAGTTYTRQEQVRLPVRTFGLYEAVVTTNYRGQLYEHGANGNNTRVDDTAIPITVRPRPDLQVTEVTAPASVDPGQTVALDFVVVNQGTVATTTANWQDRVYLSLDPVISSDDLLIASLTNQSALEPGEQYRTQTESAVVPLRFRGTVYLIVKTDAGNQMEEWPNDGNNTFYTELYVTPQPLPDLVTSDVVAPIQAVEGASIEVRYTVTNLGPGETPVPSWTDTIWLTKDKNRPHPGQGDVLLKSLGHSGSLVNKAGYDVVTNVTLPTGLVSGTYYITPWTDPYAVVLEDTLAVNVNSDDPTEIDNNNYKARAITVIALSKPSPDLTVDEVIVAPTGVGGEQYTVQWSVFNAGKGDASGSWVDEIWLTDDPTGNINTSNSLRLGRVTHSMLGDKETYEDSLTLTLTPSPESSHIVVITDAGNTVGETDESNNRLSTESVVTPRPADLQVVDIQVPSGAKSGEQTTFQFTVENTGDYPVWAGTNYWIDYVWISADVQFRADRASYFGKAVHSNTVPLQPGEQYTVEVTGTLPEGIGGDFFVYIHLDSHDEYQRDGPNQLVAGGCWHQ